MMNANSLSTLSPRQLDQRLASGTPPLLLDVREYPEFAAGHLAGARMIPLAELESQMADLPRDREIVTVCRTGRRSAQAADALRRNGFSSVSDLGGGITAWEKAGLSLERETRAPWSLERQVRFAAGVLILLGLALSYLWPPAIALAWFVPAGLILAAVTDSCAMGLLLAKLPWNRRATGSRGGGEPRSVAA